MTDAEEDAQRVEEIDVSMGELLRVAEDGTLSALTTIRVLELIGLLEEEKTDLLGFKQGS